MARISGYIVNYLADLLRPPRRWTITEWARKRIFLPSDTAEPGLYNPERAPYQKEILEEASPASPTKEIYLMFGSQCGKTLMEQIIMAYYIAAFPRPQAFAFSDEGELKLFVKHKFNPFLSANPPIQNLLGKGQKGTGDTLNEKQFPGGNIRFVAANRANNLRGYSSAVVIVDESDALPPNVEGEGSPITQLKKRQNTFENSRKFIVSSTPKNTHSHIIDVMQNSTMKKYHVPCPRCKGLMTLEFENFHYDTNEAGKAVTDAWFECPLCHGRIEEADKSFFLKSRNGAAWKATNTHSAEGREGYILPSFYVPLGWLSWKSIAQEHLDAVNTVDEVERTAKMTAFYNTVLVRQYKNAQETPSWEVLYRRALRSDFEVGMKVPAWVSVVTTGTDVQKNRLETTVMGWGKRNRNIVLDHIVMACGQGEETSDTEASCWKMYEELILNGRWEREDGILLPSAGNACDRSYNTKTVDALYLQLGDPNFMLIRGDNKHNVETAMPQRRDKKGLVYYDTPVDRIKSMVYKYLAKEDNEEQSRQYVAFFPNNLTEEFYQQLTAEELVYDKKTKVLTWEKTRDRNEALDTRVYNYAVYFERRFDAFNDSDWDDVEERRRAAAKKVSASKRKVYGRISKGVKI